MGWERLHSSCRPLRPLCEAQRGAGALIAAANVLLITNRCCYLQKQCFEVILEMPTSLQRFRCLRGGLDSL
jgi:hypothetical protein